MVCTSSEVQSSPMRTTSKPSQSEADLAMRRCSASRAGRKMKRNWPSSPYAHGHSRLSADHASFLGPIRWEKNISHSKKTKKPDTLASVRLHIWSRRQESNLDLSLRRAEFYPLKYSEESGFRQNRSHALSPIRRRLLHQLRSRCRLSSSVLMMMTLQSPGRPSRRERCAGPWAPGRRPGGRAASSGSTR